MNLCAVSSVHRAEGRCLLELLSFNSYHSMAYEFERMKKVHTLTDIHCIYIDEVFMRFIATWLTWKLESLVTLGRTWNCTATKKNERRCAHLHFAIAISMAAVFKNIKMSLVWLRQLETLAKAFPTRNIQNIVKLIRFSDNTCFKQIFPTFQQIFVKLLQFNLVNYVLSNRWDGFSIPRCKLPFWKQFTFLNARHMHIKWHIQRSDSQLQHLPHRCICYFRFILLNKMKSFLIGQRFVLVQLMGHHCGCITFN